MLQVDMYPNAVRFLGPQLDAWTGRVHINAGMADSAEDAHIVDAVRDNISEASPDHLYYLSLSPNHCHSQLFDFTLP